MEATVRLANIRGPSLLSGLLACAILSVALHLLLLPLVNSPNESAPSATWRRTVHARLLPPRPAATLVAPEGVASVQASAQADAGRSDAAHIGPQPSMSVAAQQQPADEGSPPAELEQPYLPRSELTKGPRPLDVVMIPYPSFDGDHGRYVAELSLFIDEEGLVQRVGMAPGALPPALETAVRQTFAGLRFDPGQRDGRPVRSQMRIEVSFDSGASRR